MCIQYLHMQHYYLQHHILFDASIIQVYNMHIAMCSHSSVDTHISSVAEINIDIIMCDCSLHALDGGGNVQQLLYSYLSETVL